MNFPIEKLAKESGVSPVKLRINLWKAWFEKGDGLLKYGKWAIAFVGIGGIGITNLLILGITYPILCFIIGSLWYRYDWISAEVEVGNIVNPFVKEMRDTYKK